jgi:DNA-binding XRE family transcriptional regulator
VAGFLAFMLVFCRMGNLNNSVRSARLRLGLGQLELAERAGVTRQLVGAIEAGRHSPSVDAALRIADVLGVSVEMLFRGPANDVVVGQTAMAGSPVVVGRVGERRVHQPVRHLLSLDSWAVADGFVGVNGVELFGEVDESGLVVAGCDPLLAMAAAVLERVRGPRIVPMHLSTGAAVSALLEGVVHGVVVHGPSESLPKPPVEVRRWRFASWRVGVALAARRGALGVSSITELAERRVRTAQREDGAGTQRALVRALAAVGSEGLPGPRVDGHLDAARHVVAGVAAGITMEAAACAFGLGFLPLETHHSELWIDAQHMGHRGAAALVSVLCDSAFGDRAARLPGYDVQRMGTEVLAS